MERESTREIFETLAENERGEASEEEDDSIITEYGRRRLPRRDLGGERATEEEDSRRGVIGRRREEAELGEMNGCNVRRRRVISKAKLTLSAASKLLRRKIPQSGHLMLPKRLWMQTIPTQDCEVVVVFPSNTPDPTLTWLLSRFRSRLPELSVCVRSHAATSSFAFYLSASFDGLIKGGEELRLVKRTRPEYGGGLRELSHAELAAFQGVDDMATFFTSMERQSIVLHFLNSLRATEGEELCGITFREGQAIVPKCVAEGIIAQVLPLHENKKLEALRSSWVQSFFKYQPLDAIHEYFGTKIAIYFAWLGHYTTALTVPAIIGLIFWVCFWGGDQAREDKAFVAFSFLNVVWASTWLEAWKRRSAELTYHWGTLDYNDELLVEPRPLFSGELCVSWVTGRLEPYYPVWKRNVFRYLVTVPLIILCLVVVFVVMFLILQLQDWWDELITSHEYPFFLSYGPKVLMALSISAFDEGYSKVAIWLNDKENYRVEETYQNHLIIKLAIFRFVNSFLALFYIAFYLQDMDRLKEQLAALLLTRQVVGNIKESCIPYVMEQVKLAKLSFDLFGALSPSEENKAQTWPQKEDESENLKEEEENELCPSDFSCVESASDLAKLIGGEPAEKEHKHSPSSDGQKKPENLPRHQSTSRIVSQAEVECNMSTYEGTFEDYLEMFIQFGYVTLFSSAFPLAATCAFLNNLIEIRSDAFKLCCVFQRPFGYRVQNIGVWQDAMELMGLVGIVVNCILIGLSGQVHRMFPEMSTAQTVLLIIVLEHAMIALKYGISYAIPDIPEWVASEMAKVEFRRREALRRLSTSNSPPTREDSVPPSPPISPRFFYGSMTEPVERSVQTDVSCGSRRSSSGSSPSIEPESSRRNSSRRITPPSGVLVQEDVEETDEEDSVEGSKESVVRRYSSEHQQRVSSIGAETPEKILYIRGWDKPVVNLGRSASACERVRRRTPRVSRLRRQTSADSNDSDEDFPTRGSESLPQLSAPAIIDQKGGLFRFSPDKENGINTGRLRSHSRAETIQRIPENTVSNVRRFTSRSVESGIDSVSSLRLLSQSRGHLSQSRGHISEEGDLTSEGGQSRHSRSPSPEVDVDMKGSEKSSSAPAVDSIQDSEQPTPKQSPGGVGGGDIGGEGGGGGVAASGGVGSRNSSIPPPLRKKHPSKFLKRAQSFSQVFKRKPHRKKSIENPRDDYALLMSKEPQGELALVPLEKLISIDDIEMHPSLANIEHRD